ncbi:Phage repressor protein C, contains Cro/C1-type HTH and peptisase s24 domains [Massilia sp. PDC64]|nr:S24 family peptidase [Massilia sp. PDC64]SDC70052.1 Phage repressor protein C, contains Cro/C1-type HTH and peptisase s24 domains [Massilia sp. PDC64]
MNLLSERLRWAIAEEEKRRGGKPIRKADLARAAKTSQTSAGFWLSDVNGIKGEKARLLGEFLHVNPVWLETGVGSPVPIVTTNYDDLLNRTMQAGDDADRPPSVIAYDPEDGLPDGVVLVPESRIEFSAGNGKEVTYEVIEDAEPAIYRRSWLRKHGLKPERVRRFQVSGDSQEPTLFHGDTVLVNLDETNIVDGKLYAIRYDNDLRIKFIFRKLDGTLILRSKNAAYPDEEVPPQLANEHISIIGRVRDKSGKGGL